MGTASNEGRFPKRSWQDTQLTAPPGNLTAVGSRPFGCKGRSLAAPLFVVRNAHGMSASPITEADCTIAGGPWNEAIDCTADDDGFPDFTCP
jgi:hypothetical protein